jgi:hypothetical protein
LINGLLIGWFENESAFYEQTHFLTINFAPAQQRYTFPDVIFCRFKANFPHTADAALVASALHIN